MSVTEQLRELAHHGYPSSGADPWHDDLGGEPFGPGGDTSLTDAARPITMYGFSPVAVRPTESQAARAQTRAQLATGLQPVVPADGSDTARTGSVSSQVGALPVLTLARSRRTRQGPPRALRVPRRLGRSPRSLVAVRRRPPRWNVPKPPGSPTNPRLPPRRYPAAPTRPRVRGSRGLPRTNSSR